MGNDTFDVIMKSDVPAVSVRNLESKSEKFEVPCAEGVMPFRRWTCCAPGCETLLLVHGGSGSWTHWYRNIEYLSQRFNVYAVDLPGLGDSAELPAGYRAEDVVAVVSRGIASLPGLATFHLVAFSWGCAVSAQLAKSHELKSLLLLGPAALGDIPRRGHMKPLIRRTEDMSAGEIYDANKENLARLMFYNRERIDDLAVYLQTSNTNRARFNSPQFARTTLVLDGVKAITTPLKVIYGEHDAPAGTRIEQRHDLFQSVRSDVEFEIIPDAGHWLQYELSDVFNKKCAQWIEQHAGFC